VVRKTTASY